MYQLICDLCGEPIKEKHRELKIKEFKYLPFQWQEIDAHDECVKAVAAAARERAENEEQLQGM